MANALNGEEFSLPDAFAERQDYSITPSEPTQDTNNQDNFINCNKNMNSNKKVVRLTESKLKQLIAESLYQVLTEKRFNDDFGEFNIHDDWFDEKALKTALDDGAFDTEDKEAEIIAQLKRYNNRYDCHIATSETFKNGYIKVIRDCRYNYMNSDGELLSPTFWFTSCSSFGRKENPKDCADVTIAAHHFLIDTSGYLYFKDTGDPLGINIKQIKQLQELELEEELPKYFRHPELRSTPLRIKIKGERLPWQKDQYYRKTY